MRPPPTTRWTISTQREVRRGHDDRGRLQRLERHEPAGEPAEHQPGAAVGGERSDRPVRPRQARRAAELAGELAGRPSRPASRSRTRTSRIRAVQTNRSVAQALRPFPQYNDHQHDQQRRRQDRQVDVSRRRPQADAADDRRVPVPGQLHVLEADDQRRRVQRQHRLDGYGAARARILDRPARSDAQHQAEHRATSCRGDPDKRWLTERCA